MPNLFLLLKPWLNYYDLIFSTAVLTLNFDLDLSKVNIVLNFVMNMYAKLNENWTKFARKLQRTNEVQPLPTNKLG